jgi:hypothetical protein
MVSDPLLYFNGIDRATGKYLQPPIPLSALAGKLREHIQPFWREVRGRPVPEVDERDLASAGWGVVFGAEVGDEVRCALEELLDHRRDQAGAYQSHYFRAYRGERGVLPGDTSETWLARQGGGAGPADPEQVPYYLLLVGSPEDIPFDFQFELGIQRAVGRLCFDHLDDYRTYACKVVTAERSAPVRPRRLTLFGVDNPDDPATSYTTEDLIVPLLTRLPSRAPDWNVEGVLGAAATKERLRMLLGGEKTPALLFTASHGLATPENDLPGELGSILCGDWPGPQAWNEEIPPGFYFAAADLPAGTDLTGLVSFHFACYSAGIPLEDSFGVPGDAKRRLASRACLARLPQRLLTHGALAVIGHVDRAWCHSFLDQQDRQQLQTFSAVLTALLRGLPAGMATQYLSERYADLQSGVSRWLIDIAAGKTIDREAFARDWIALADARSYLLLGDPAVRLRTREQP